MPISETLLLPGFKTISDICRPSSSAVRHARTPASLTAAAMVLAENAPAFSSRPSVSSTKSDLLGHALRTSLASELEALTGFSLRWNRSATPAGRSWWVLGTPARRTEGTERGLLLPTPRTADGDRGGRGDLIRAICGNENKHFRNSLLPTPTAVNYGSNQGGAAGRTGPIRPSLASLTRGVHGANLLLSICEWLMGYPAGWLADASRHTEMLSFRRSPKRSDAP